MSFLDQITADRRRRLPLAGLLIRGVVAATAWLLLFLPLGLGPAESWLPTSCFAALLAIYAAAALLYYLRKTPAVTPLIVTAADVVAISLLFFVTGGGSGLYVALYAIALIGATVFGSTRQTLVAALGGFVLLAAVTVALAVGVPSLSAGSGATDHAAASLWAVLLGLAFCAALAVPANIYLRRRLAEYREVIKERDERLSAANRELTRSFYDLESLTDRVRAEYDSEQELQRRLVLAQRFAKFGQLAAGVVQDMTNPITAIMAETEMLLLKPEDQPAKTKDASSRILANANRLATLTDNLRLFVRQESEMIYGAVDVHQMIKRCLNALEPLRRKRGASCTLRLADRLLKVLGVESQLEQVLVNLLTNAYQSLTGAGGQVTVRTNVEGERVRIEVEDNGVGIAPELREKVFEPFFTTRQDSGSLGLGLHTAKAIIEEQNGKISVRSNPGVSTVFTVELPIVPEGTAAS